jgi:hypothetical protein
MASTRELKASGSSITQSEKVHDPPILMIGHFSPPVHGLSIAMDKLSDLLEVTGPVIRIRTVPRRALPRFLYHVSRCLLVSRAVLELIRNRGRAKAVVFSVDAGHGMLYCIWLSAVARFLGYGITLDHHSNAYVTHRSGLTTILVAVAGRSSTHLFKCELVLRKFRHLYSLQAHAAVLGVAGPMSRPGHWLSAI